MTSAFIDTNVFIYHLTDNHAEFSPRCSALLEDVASGKILAHTAITAIDETLRVLTKVFGHDRMAAAGRMIQIVQQPEIRIEHRAAVVNAIEFWTQQSPLSFIDCYHRALAEELGLSRIFSFDRKMDRYPGIERIEPELAATDKT